MKARIGMPGVVIDMDGDAEAIARVINLLVGLEFQPPKVWRNGRKADAPHHRGVLLHTLREMINSGKRTWESSELRELAVKHGAAPTAAHTFAGGARYSGYLRQLPDETYVLTAKGRARAKDTRIQARRPR